MSAYPLREADDGQRKLALEVENLSKVYGRNRVLRQVSLSMAQGEVAALLGPSGSGKTTLGEIISGVTKPDTGKVMLGGVDMTSRRAEQRGISLAPQEWELFPHLSALHNVAFGLWTHGVSRQTRISLSESWLEKVGLGEKASALPHQLSGGQQQRIALARALAAPNGFAVLDEPFANVDQDTRRTLRELVRGEAERGKGILLITHDREDALLLADMVICLHRGRVVQTGTPQEVYEKPSSLLAARLTGDASQVPASALQAPARVWIDRAGPVSLDPANSEVRGKYHLVIRPDWLEVVDGPPFHFEGIVSKLEYRGGNFLITVNIGDSVALVFLRRRVLTGKRVRLLIRNGVLPPAVEKTGDEHENLE